MNRSACVNDVLVAGSDDWVDMAEVAHVAKTVGGAATTTEAMRLSIEIVREVVSSGLMKAGDVTLDGFHEWDLPVNEVLDRIEREWAVLRGLPKLGEICWLCSTEEGDNRARQLAGGRGPGVQPGGR